MVTPLSDYYDFENDPNWKGSDPKGNLLWAGKKYGLFEGAQTPTGGLWYNKALLKKENIVDPAELVKKNEWTWDKFLEMCKKLTKDTNGDGKTDQWGYYDIYLFVNAIITNGGALIDKSNANKPKFNLDTEPNKRAIQWAYDLVKTYKVVPKVGTTDDMEMFGLFYNNKVAFFTYLAEYGPLCVNKGMNADDLGYTFFPKGPDAKDYYLCTNFEHCICNHPSDQTRQKGSDKSACRLFMPLG
jgi:ABC-type glycerol-3-phosphate transport system substrate-binding protein